MKIYMSADIEGVAGVVIPAHQRPGNAEYEDARRLMTAETNAAIEGAFVGGATEVLVNDSHGPMTNILPDLLDPRAELIRGNIKHGGMFAGLDDSYAGVICLGYHARAADYGVLAHTTSDFAFARTWLNGEPASEAMFYGAYAGAMGVPVIMLSGDDVTEAHCGSLFLGSHFARVKSALGQRAARALSPRAAQALIRKAAEAAVRDAHHIKPYRVAEPCDVAFKFTSVFFADICATIPVAERRSPLTVGFKTETALDAIRWMRVCSSLGGHVRLSTN
ncbi:M55 family metallopeptidase [Acidisoma cellulosilytica]|uniref:M55 family metallopeptidase n=1 Tax=Acidisoma cellulosilyticum TaxID=2802395 RepID=A0A964E565_9PROT|nr:M55 family metallopeptidase [Acidisoma cellulosilyticum]MCB8882179.1 M55 family metallopeptidase [Acidisoma cellulosilyticum]